MATVTEALKQWRFMKGHGGGGGFVKKLDVHSDGSVLAGGDVFGTFVLQGTDPTTDVWASVFNRNNVDVADINSPVDSLCAPYDVKFAPSNSNIIYQVQYFYKPGFTTYYPIFSRSTDKGANWTAMTGFSTSPFSSMNGNVNAGGANYIPSNGNGALQQRKMWVDPEDPDHVLFGDRLLGLHRTTDGGATWATIATVLAPTGNTGNTGGITGLIHNPAAAPVGGKSGEIYVCSYGRGWYKSTDGGATFSALTGSPTSCMDATFTASGLYMIAIDDSQTVASKVIRRYSTAADTWTVITPSPNINNGAQTLDVDPFDDNRLVVVGTGGGVIETTNLTTVSPSSGWGTYREQPAVNTMTFSDIAWGAMSMETGFKSTAVARFHRTIQNCVMIAEGIGMFYADIQPGFSSIAWQSFTDETSLLIATNGVSAPGGPLYLGSWDRPAWKINDWWNYPSTYIAETLRASGNINTLSNTFAMDCAVSDPSYAIVTTAVQGGSCFGFVTSDNGATFSELTALNAAGANFDNGAGRWQGGAIAISTPLNHVLFMTANSNGNRPRYTTDGGSTYSVCAFASPMVAWNGTGSPTASTTAAGFYAATQSIRRTVVVADGSTANTFWAVHPYWGTWSSTDSGANWTQVDAASALGYLGTATASEFSRLRAVRGQAGHLLYTPGGKPGLASRPQVRSMYATKAASGGWTAITDVREVMDIAVGPTAPGASYPTIWIMGWVNYSSSYQWGIYYTTSGIDALIAGTASWKKTASEASLDRLDVAWNLVADANIHERACVGFSGSGWMFTDGAPAGYQRGFATCV